MENQRINVSRQPIKQISSQNVESLGASYTHLQSLKGIVGSKTKRIVIYHAFLESLEGLEETDGVEVAYLGFNRIRKFREIDRTIQPITTLDLAGNPLTSLKNCPPCVTLIVSATLITDLVGCPEGLEIIRCGHSTHLRSLKGCPATVKVIECSCAPNLMIDNRDLPEGLEELLTGTA